MPSEGKRYLLHVHDYCVYTDEADMKKLTKKEYENYWQSIHRKVTDDMAAVCFPDKPLYFNLFFDRIQKHAIKAYLNSKKIEFTGKNLLDIGCGRGRWLSFFSQKGASVSGIDLSPVAVEVCRKKGFNAYEGSITQMPFDKDSFDFVNSTTVLLHLPYDIKKQAISEIARILKPEGKALLIENTWADPSPHVYSQPVAEWERNFKCYDMELVHGSAHCFNFFRRYLPNFTPFRDFLSIYLDYPLEYALMHFFYLKESRAALQHFMVFEKRLV